VPHRHMGLEERNDGTYALTVTFEESAPTDIAAVDVQNQVARQRQLPQPVLQAGVTVAKRTPRSCWPWQSARGRIRAYAYLFSCPNTRRLHVTTRWHGCTGSARL